MSAQDLRERFFATPLVTRSLAASAWASVVLNIVTAGAFDDLVCASPHDIVRRWQVWRLVTSVLYVPNVFSALFLSFILYRVCSGWERERGSLRMAHYFVVGVVGTNAGTALLAVLVAPFAPGLMAHTYVCAPGIQNALFVLCARITLGYPGPGVNLFGRSSLFVPAKRIPLALFAAFVALGARPAEAAAAVALSVLWAQGSLRRVTPSDVRLQLLERARALRRVVAARGYVSCAAAGPNLPSSRDGDPAALGFLQHVRERAFAFEDETMGSGTASADAAAMSAAAPLRRLAPRAGGGASVGFPERARSGNPGNPWGRQNVHLSRSGPDPLPAPAGLGAVSGAGTSSSRLENTRDEPKLEAPAPATREARAAAFASAAEKRRERERERDERGDERGGAAT